MKYIFYTILLNLFATTCTVPSKTVLLGKWTRKAPRSILKRKHYACLVARIKILENRLALLEQQNLTFNNPENTQPFSTESYILEHNMHYGNRILE